MFRRRPVLVLDHDPAQEDQALRAAVAAGRNGDWGPARDLMATVRHDNDRRARCVYVLAESISGQMPAPGRRGAAPPVDTDAAWMDRWAATEPTNPNAHLVRARSLIVRAWDVRGGGWSSTVGEDAALEFLRTLHLALTVNDQAAALAPDDPTPWAQRLLLMVALSADRATFERAWSELVRRDPQHREAHGFKLMYLCRKWHGSHEEMFQFARATAAAAPDGSPLHALPLHAQAEWDLWETQRESGGLRNLRRVGQIWRNDPNFKADLDNALNRWFRRPAGKHAMWYNDLNHLAYALVRSRREAEAKPVFEAIGPYAETFPWAWSDLAVTAEQAFLIACSSAMRA
jgi:hypothetical protein